MPETELSGVFSPAEASITTHCARSPIIPLPRSRL